MPKTEEGLYELLEEVLAGSSDPLDAAQLWDMPNVRELAPSLNRISDYLGNLWRKGKVTRLPAPTGGTSRTRWMYLWKGVKKVAPDLSKAVEHAPNIVLHKANIKITDEGNKIVIEQPNILITIQLR